MNKFVLAVGMLLVSMNSFSQGIYLQGVGTFSCGEYIEMRTEKNEAQNAVIVSWVWGYMAGFNMETKKPTTQSLPDQPSTLAYIDKYCRENPLNNVIIATNALIKDLGGKRNPR